jgi:hypothetical protein
MSLEASRLARLASYCQHCTDTTCHTFVLERWNQSPHTCAHDVQITHTANNKVNNSQCHDYNNNRVYLLQNEHMSEKRLQSMLHCNDYSKRGRESLHMQ